MARLGPDGQLEIQPQAKRLNDARDTLRKVLGECPDGGRLLIEAIEEFVAAKIDAQTNMRF